MQPTRYDPFKRGDTPVFVFNFTLPSAGYSWTNILVDAVMTSVASPTDNNSAAVKRIGESLTIKPDGGSTFQFQPTPEESRALVPGTEYMIEVQLRDTANPNVATAVTGKVKIIQDFVI